MIVSFSLACVIAFALGTATGAWGLYRMLPARLKQHVDYRERWLEAVSLLGAQGQLTKDQVKKITGPAPAPARPAVHARPAGRPAFRAMFSSDRRDIEIERAKHGLPPQDDLSGMFSSDVKAVLKARAKYAPRAGTDG